MIRMRVGGLADGHRNQGRRQQKIDQRIAELAQEDDNQAGAFGRGSTLGRPGSRARLRRRQAVLRAAGARQCGGRVQRMPRRRSAARRVFRSLSVHGAPVRIGPVSSMRWGSTWKVPYRPGGDIDAGQSGGAAAAVPL